MSKCQCSVFQAHAEHGCDRDAAFECVYCGRQVCCECYVRVGTAKGQFDGPDFDESPECFHCWEEGRERD